MELVPNTTNISANFMAIQLLSSTSILGNAYYDQGEIRFAESKIITNDVNSSDIMLASEEILLREWDNPEEDEAWAHL